MNQKGRKEERIPDWTSDSFTDVPQFGMASLSSFYGDTEDMTTSQRNAMRLRDCADPVDLTTLLSEIWKPNSETKSPFEVGAKEGTIHDLDVSKVLFFSENICKKLIAFIAFPQTTKDAKNAAVDVFTWFCTQPALEKSLFVGSGMICNWLLSLCGDADAAVSLAGLRGLVTLVSHDGYRKALQDSEKLIHIIDKIDLDTEMSRRSSTFVFMICATIMTLEGKFKDHGQLMKKLQSLPCLGEAWLAPEEQFWSISCFLMAIMLSDERIALMEKELPKLMSHSITTKVKEQLIDKCTNTYIAMAKNWEEENLFDVDELMKHKGIIEKLFQRLYRDTVAVLKLIATIADDNPDRIFKDFLEAYWPKLLHLLSSDNKDSQSLVLRILSSVSRVPVADNKRILPGNDRGVHLVKLLGKEITEQRTGILLFLWTHYSEVESAFVEANVIRSMLALYAKTDETVTAEMSVKIKNLLCALLENEQDAVSRIQDEMIHGFSHIIEMNDTSITLSNRVLALDVLTACIKHSCDSKISRWLLEEGLRGVVKMASSGEQCTKDMQDVISSLLETVLATFSEPLGAPHSIQMFVWSLKAIDLCPDTSLAETMGKHDWPKVKSLTCRDHLDNLSDAVLDERSLRVLSGLITQNSQDRTGFLAFLLSVLLECGLRETEEEAIDSSGIPVALFQLLNQWTTTKSDEGHSSQALLLCIGAVQSRPLQQAHCFSSRQSQPISKLWELLIEHGGTISPTEKERRALLSCLRTGDITLGSSGYCIRCNRITSNRSHYTSASLRHGYYNTCPFCRKSF